jgi:hypothetical protein
VVKNRNGLIIALAVAAVVVGAVIFRPATEKAEVAETPTASSPPPAESPPGTAPAEPAIEQSRTAPPPPAITQDAMPLEEEEDPSKITFKADAKGRMVTDQSARLNLERLNALFTPAERRQKLEELSATLPPAAARDLNDMMERYINYDAAARQTFPPGQELSSPEEGLTLIDGMHNLRVQYFGAEAADGFFAKEERMQRELLRLMSLDKDDSLTLEEKAERAQAMYETQMPETTAEMARGNKPKSEPAPPKKN